MFFLSHLTCVRIADSRQPIKKMDERFTQASGAHVYTGCELLVKGALESGVSLLTGYPGSPIAGSV